MIGSLDFKGSPSYSQDLLPNLKSSLILGPG